MNQDTVCGRIAQGKSEGASTLLMLKKTVSKGIRFKM